jgi:nucleoside-diphosphate-sugar epimerase
VAKAPVGRSALRTDVRLEHTIFRPHNVYGEHQNVGDKYRNVVGIFMNRSCWASR